MKEALQAAGHAHRDRGRRSSRRRGRGDHHQQPQTYEDGRFGSDHYR
jgi:hypothetical protein